LLRWSRHLKEHEFVSGADLVYTISFKPHLAAALGWIRPTVWHLHEFPPTTTGWLWRLLARRLPTAMIANSAAVADAWGPLAALAPGQLTTIHNGVDLDRFTPRPPTKWIHDELGIGRERRLIGMPAVLAEWKGHLQVAEAFRRIQSDVPDAELVFVGGTIYDTVAEQTYGAQLQRVVAASERIHVLSFQEAVERVYPEFDVTIHYSQRPEPFGRVILESMACGVPVIAAGEGGPKEILGAGGAGGWLVEPRSASSLATVLRAALDQTAEARQAIGGAGRQRASELFSSGRFARETASVLRTAARRSSTG
jgi:glycosyltransferase involved in cell wall biosynthesis